jgi:hypothetical protein
MNLSPTPLRGGEGQIYFALSTKKEAFQSLSPCRGEVWRGVFKIRRTHVKLKSKRIV